MYRVKQLILLSSLFTLVGCASSDFDVIIKNGRLYDGSGGSSYIADIAISADTIAVIGDLKDSTAAIEIDASGMAVAPGFINMLSWANNSLIEDGRSQSDIRQGVTLEILGEGTSMGPLNDSMKVKKKRNQQTIIYDVDWTTLGEYLDFLVDRGVSSNVASFVGNGTLREYVMEYENRLPTESELNKMKELTRQAMEEGAMGISTSLIYVPSGHAQTEEIIELAKVVAEYDGMYISHIRGEGKEILESVAELITICREAKIRSEIYHFKVSGVNNWQMMDDAIKLLEEARNEGLPVTTDMYMYNASSTGLNIVLPKWSREGGHDETIGFIEDKETRQQMIDEVDFYTPPDKILLVGFKNKDLRKWIGKTLAEVAAEKNVSAKEAVVDLIQEDDSRIQVVYFSMLEENVVKKLALPYVHLL